MPPARFRLRADLRGSAVRGDGAIFAVDGLVVACCGYAVEDGRPASAAGALARAYARHGEALSAHLLGQYAAAIVDPIRGRVVLVQDSLGLRTAHYRLSGGVLTVASDLPSLVELTGAAELDERYFAEYLAYGVRPFGRTPYAGIEKLSLGQTVVVDARGARTVVPWTPSAEPAVLRVDEAAERLRRLLGDAVAAALPEEGRVLCELSGGLDSSTVIATAHRVRPDVEAVTLTSSSGRASDDIVYARDVVARLGVPWHTLDQDPHPLFGAGRAEAEPGGEIRTAIRAAYYALLAERGADVLLTGSGGDQAFGSVDVQPVHIADDLLRGRLRGAWRAAGEWRAVTGSVRPEAFWIAVFGLRAASRHVRGRSLVFWNAQRRPAWLRREFLARFALPPVPPQIAHRVAAPSRQYLWEMVYRLAENEARVVNLGPPCERRHPLFHRPFMDFMVSLPPALRRGAAGERVLQRYALGDRLPPSVLSRVTKGSNQQLREQTFLSSDWIARLVDRPQAVERGWLDAAEWRRAVQRARFGVVRQAVQFDAAMCTEMWLRARAALPAPGPAAELPPLSASAARSPAG
ncbi:MAG TPA: asparagine synthase-related protein [Dongiaceae bacterium]|nr:asparagine synthase-related protein [Dongiaceae bacterium]